MSVNKHYREAWIDVVYAEAVSLFHQARKANQDDVPLVDLARQCANTAFQERAHQIVGDKETLARAFMAHCRDHFDTEINVAIAAEVEKDIAATQLEAQEAVAN